MKNRALALTAVVLLGSVGVAAAAPPPKPVCNLLVDPGGDTFIARQQEGRQEGPQEDSLDILSADIATNATTMTGVIRVRKAAKTAQTSPTGNGYAVEFLIPGSTFTMSLRAIYTATGDAYEVSYKDGSVPNAPSTMIAKVTGVFDTQKNEIRISTPLSAFSGHGGVKPGNKITGLSAYSGRAVPPVVAEPGRPITTRFVFADASATGAGKPYTAGARSCVPIGK